MHQFRVLLLVLLAIKLTELVEQPSLFDLILDLIWIVISFKGELMDLLQRPDHVKPWQGYPQGAQQKVIYEEHLTKTPSFSTQNMDIYKVVGRPGTGVLHHQVAVFILQEPNLI